MEKIVVSCLESRIDENQSVYSRFLLGPFLSGHAVTVATALRRALLSEVKNIAVTALHIQGVTHEFSTLVGIRESVLELSLNFQQIILSTQTRTRSVQVGYLHVQGPAIVHANDLKLPDGVECVNPTQYIATISTEGLLVVKFLIGEKKSFLKGNATTLNNKKLKQAKAYSAQLSNSLLSHAEYDPPRLFHALRASSLPNEVCTANLLSTSSHGGLAEHPKIGPVASTNNALGGTTNEPLAILQEQTATAGSLVRGTTAPAAGALTRAKRSPALRVGACEMITVDADSKVDQLENRISDEFNSEICLRTIIPLDPIFTPVYQVNFGIERDDLSNQVRERVIMEVWTNGSIHPRQAVNEAALSIMSIFSKLRKTFQLDSHSLAIPANSTACRPPARSLSVSKAVGLARNSRLHRTRNIVKGEPLNSAASQRQERFARMDQGKFVNFRKFARAKLAQTRFDLTNPAGLCQTVRFGMLPEGAQRRGLSRSPLLLLPAAGASAYSPSCSAQLTAPTGDKAALSPLIPLKLKSFSSLGFVRSRHPVALFLQDFGKSHIRGQTFLLEQSFGLKTRFFKGHRAVLSKVKYISEAHTLKRTFLPSFKLVLGPSSLALRATAPAAGAPNQRFVTGRHADRSCLSSKLKFANRTVGPLQGARQTERFGIGRQAKSKPILFLIKYRTFSFTRNALRVFGCKQEDSSFLLPVTKQLIRLKMARVLNSCLPLMSKRLEPSFISQVIAPQRRDRRLASLSKKVTAAIAHFRWVPAAVDHGPVRQTKDLAQTEGLEQAGALARSAQSRIGNNRPTDDSSLALRAHPPYGRVRARACEQNCSILERPDWHALGRRAQSPVGLTGVSHALALRASECSPSGSKALRAQSSVGRVRSLVLRTSARESAITTVEDLRRLDVKQLLLSLAPRTNTSTCSPAAGAVALSTSALTRPTDECERESAGSRSFTPDPTDGSVVNDLELSGAQKRFASSILLCGLAPLDKIWLRSNLEKQFGFLQFAYNALRADSAAGVWHRAGGRSSAGWEERLLPERTAALRATAAGSGWCRRHLERLGVCVNKTAPAAVSAQTRLAQADYLPRVIVPAADKSKSYARLFETQAAEPIPETPFEFTTFPLIMTKVPPLSLPSGLVTLLSYPFQYRAGTVPAASRYRPLARHVSKLNAGLARRRRGLVKFSKPDGRRVLGRLVAIRPSTHGPAAGAVAPAAGCSPKSPEPTAPAARLWRARQTEGLAQAVSAARRSRARPHSSYGRVSRGLSKSRCCSTADLFGFNSDGSVRLKPPIGDSCLQFTTQERLTSLYSSNLDKMSFLSSDLANLSLSLKTYTFLKKKGKGNIASLLEDSPNTLFSLLNGNEKMFHEIERCLIFLGLPFKGRS